MRAFWRWFLGYLDCPRCDTPMQRTSRIVNRVEYVWVCEVCGGQLSEVDRGLVAARRRELAAAPVPPVDADADA